MLRSREVTWRGAAVALGVLFSALAAEAEAMTLQGGGNGSYVAGANVTALSSGSEQILTVPLKRVNHRGVATPSLGKRFTRTDVLGVFGAAYLAELTIGTSKNGKNQVVDVLIDTGSFELWVNPVCASSNVPDFCQVFGHYHPALSSTSQKISSGSHGFNIKYGSGQVMGDYYKDDIYISGTKIKDQQFGVANTSDLVWFGIMGLGHGQGNGFINYPLVVDSLAAQKVTNTKLFSMDLGRQMNPGATITGELVFGGVDRNKYAGFLKKVPTDPKDAHYRVQLHSLSHRAPGARDATPLTDPTLPVSVIVDSGTTLSLLPEPIVNKLAAQFPGAQSDGNGGYRVDCAYQEKDGSVDFGFLAGKETVVINVAYKDFVWNSGGDCFLGAWFSDDLDVWILGDAFLRGAYVTFDQTNNALFMSNQVSCGNGQSNLVAVPAGPDAAGRIPGACPEIHAPPPPASPSPSSTSAAPFAEGSVSGGDATSLTSSAGPSLNPVEPTDLRTLTVSISASSSSSSASPAPGSGDPKVLPEASGAGESGAATMTVTGTVTRAVVYTKTACPDSVTDCPLRGKVATRFETIVTTFCPEHDHASRPGPTPTGVATEAVLVTESSAPAAAAASTSVTKIGDTGSWNGGEDRAHHQQQQQQQQGQQQQGQAEEGGRNQIMTTAYTATTTYAITSCNPADAACTIGKTTTRAITLVKTVHVQARPTPSPSLSSSSPPPSSNNRNTTWNPAQSPVVVAAAGPTVDDGQVDKRYLGAVFVAVWGLMVLL
ncbi:aspartic peptidase domain-containing protein [Nemania sp. FL0031]|nr:aspartic peptidase domain-containing protein [Nemania sp. FL0031]